MNTLAQVPLLPFVQNAQDVIFFFFVFLRVVGLFMVSPLLSHTAIKNPLKGLLAFLVAALMASVLWPEYRGEDARYALAILDPEAEVGILLIALVAFKELAVGFVIGFCFTFAFEALIMAGQMVSVVIGFSIAEIIDPVSGASQSIISNLFVITGMLFVLVLDLHHVIFQACSYSFGLVPIGHYFLPYDMLHDITHGSARVLAYSMQYAAIPYSILFLITLGLGFMAKVMPEMNIFMVGFPLRIFVGYYGLIFAISYFPILLSKSFIEYTNVIDVILRRIGTGT